MAFDMRVLAPGPRCPGCVARLTPHTASAGEVTRDAMGMLDIDNVAGVLAGAGAGATVNDPTVVVE